MRIAIGQLWQETNTFNPVLTTRDDFEQMGVSRGLALVEEMAQTNELGGFIQSLKAWPERPEILGLVRLPAWPNGPATRETFTWLASEMESALKAALPVDGVLLALHGSMVAQGHPDVEGEVLQTARRILGNNAPLVATLDLHAHITSQMIEAADALVLYHCMPHVDIAETGHRGAEVLRRILIEGAEPVTAWQRVPVVLPAERADTEAQTGFAVERKRTLQKLEAEKEVLAAGVAVVQPWLDIPDLGSTVCVTTDNNRDRAAEICGLLAENLWQTRREYLPELVDAAQAVRRAHDAATGLTVLSDAADSTTSGAPGDSVWLLQELLKYPWPRPVLVPLAAPEIVQQAQQAGALSTVSASFGGVRDTRFGSRIALEVVVDHLFHAKFIMSGHIGKNMPIDMGPSAVLRRDNVFVIATSRTGPHFAPELFQAAGLDPFQASVVVAKSPCGFRAVYRKHARQMISVRAPGCAPSDFWNYEYQNIHRPLWPWDEMEDWNRGVQIRMPKS